MKREEIKEKVLEIVKVTLAGRIEVTSIDGDENFVAKYGINSIEAIEIIVRIENEFNVEVSDENLSVDFISNIKNIVDFIEKNLK